MKTKKLAQAIGTALAGKGDTQQHAGALRLLLECLKPRGPFCDPGTKVLSRDGKDEGTTTGGQRPCTLEGCTGVRIAVRWPNGKITYPCTKGLDYTDGKYQIM